MEKVAARSPGAVDVVIGARIRERRRSFGMSQTALAEHTGVTFQQIQKYERGTNRVSAPALIKIARAFECRVGDLLGEEPPAFSFAQSDLPPESEELLTVFKGLDGAGRSALLKKAKALQRG